MGITTKEKQAELTETNVSVPAEQKAYASLLAAGMKISLCVMIVIFGLYISAFVRSAHVPLEDLPNCWGMSVKEFVKHTGISTGWGWLNDAMDGHYLNYLPIIILSTVSCLCYARIIPILLRKRDLIYTVIAITEIAIVVLAASGILAVGH